MYPDEIRVELLDDAAEFLLREPHGIEDVRVRVGEGRSQVAGDKEIAADADDARRGVLGRVDWDVRVEVGVAGVLGAPFLDSVALHVLAHDGGVGRGRDGRADAIGDAGDAREAGIEDVGASFEVLGEGALALFDCVGGGGGCCGGHDNFFAFPFI